MDIDRGRNCYAYGGFRHIVWHYRNRGAGNRIGKGRRLEYGNRENNEQRKIKGRNKANNLNGKRDLIVFN